MTAVCVPVLGKYSCPCERHAQPHRNMAPQRDGDGAAQAQHNRPIGVEDNSGGSGHITATVNLAPRSEQNIPEIHQQKHSPLPLPKSVCYHFKPTPALLVWTDMYSS